MSDSATEEVLVLPSETSVEGSRERTAMSLSPGKAGRLTARDPAIEPDAARLPAPVDDGEQFPLLDPDSSELSTTRPLDGRMVLPGHARAGVLGILSFVALVIVPVLAAAFYFFAVASDQYVSQFRFMVTETPPATLTPQSTGSSSMQGASAVMGALGVANLATAQNYIVTDYLSSPQAVQDLESRIKVSRLFSKPEVDVLSRFDPTKPIEDLTRYWQKMITSRYDPITGLATADVRAFSPSDAKLIATTLVTLSEELVNRIDMRAKLDAVRFAENEVERAEARLKSTRGALTDFRNKEGVIDPTSSVVPGNVQDIATTRAALIQLQTELDTLHKQRVSPGSPIETSLQARLAATQQQLQNLQGQVGKDRGGSAVLTNIVGRYEQLDLDRQYAQNLLVSAMQALDQARLAASSQNLYLTPYVSPSLPGSSTYPNRWQSLGLFALTCFGLWVVVSLLYRAIRDRY